MKKFMFMLVLGCASLAFNVAHGHGNAEPEHGGVLNVVGDMTFELVANATGAELYVEDDGEELSSEGLNAKLTIVSASGKSDVTMKPAGGNKFEAKGVSLASGTKVAVMLTLKDKQSKIGTNFTIK